MSTATQTSTGQQPPHSAGSRPGSGAGIDQTLRWFGLATHLVVGVVPFTATGLLAPSGASSPWAPGTRSSPSQARRSHGRRDGPPNSRCRVQS